MSLEVRLGFTPLLLFPSSDCLSKNHKLFQLLYHLLWLPAAVPPAMVPFCFNSKVIPVIYSCFHLPYTTSSELLFSEGTSTAQLFSLSPHQHDRHDIESNHFVVSSLILHQWHLPSLLPQWSLWILSLLNMWLMTSGITPFVQISCT